MIAIPKGTKDCLPAESYKWHYVENAVREVTAQFNYREIRTPVFEHTELFARGVGDTTDIVNKEMYTFVDKGERSMTLKPEGTAGVARSFIENSLHNSPQPSKMYYITPVFRYEKPQSGRLREHHQFGVELYGSTSPMADAEVITLAKNLFERLGIVDVALNINSIGCPECRKTYADALKAYFGMHIDKLCPTCLERLEKNPLRVLDCKVENCKVIAENAPIVLDYLCEDCKNHHETLKDILATAGVEYSVNPKIVRGLDYYTRTVFEFISTNIGSQGTVCGGGRYNNLVESLGGKSMPAVGFGMGLERLLMVMENAGLNVGKEDKPFIYFASLGARARKESFRLTSELRKNGISCDCDLMEKSLKAQMKFADKNGYNYVMVLGDEEIERQEAVLKDMQKSVETKIAFSALSETLRQLY